MASARSKTREKLGNQPTMTATTTTLKERTERKGTRERERERDECVVIALAGHGQRDGARPSSNATL